MKKDKGLSSSSDSEDSPKKQAKAMPKFAEQVEETKTNGSIKLSSEPDNKFQLER